MDDRQKNLIKSLSGAGAVFAGVITLYLILIAPIQNHQTEKFLEQCYLAGLECTVEINWLIPFGLAIIPFLSFVALYHHFESKRRKTWRSYR